MMDPYFGYIAASYAVTFGAIALLVLAIVLNYRSANASIEKLKQSGVRRRSDNKTES